MLPAFIIEEIERDAERRREHREHLPLSIPVAPGGLPDRDAWERPLDDESPAHRPSHKQPHAPDDGRTGGAVTHFDV